MGQRELFAASILEWWWNDPKVPSVQVVVEELRNGTRTLPAGVALIALPFGGMWFIEFRRPSWIAVLLVLGLVVLGVYLVMG